MPNGGGLLIDRGGDHERKLLARCRCVVPRPTENEKMILFKPEHIEMIKTGRKTQTRRVWKAQRAKVGSLHKIKTAMISPAFYGFIEIKNVYREPLGSMTDADAKAEGYNTLEEFRAVWERINGPGSWDPEMYVYVVEFGYLGGV